MDEATLERVLQAIDVIDFEAGLSAILTGLLSNARGRWVLSAMTSPVVHR